VVTHALEGFRLTVDRGPNWLFIKLRPKRHFAEDIPQIADELWSIASRHFIYRLVVELDELRQLPVDLVDQLVILQERLAQCDGSLRICGLSADCARKLRDSQLDAALPNYATRQEAVLGGDAVALHEKLKEMLSGAASDDQMQAAAAFARCQPSLQ
jgi:anti-sigma B factor antagonist